MSSKTIFDSSAVGFSKSTHRKRFVSAKSVGIRNMGMFSVCSRPWVVNAKDRITLGHPDTNAAASASQQQVTEHDQECCSAGVRQLFQMYMCRLPDRQGGCL